MYKNQQDRKIAVRFYVRQMAEATPKNSNQHCCLNMTRIKTKAIGVLTRKGDISWTLKPTQRTIGTIETLRTEKSSFPVESTSTD